MPFWPLLLAVLSPPSPPVPADELLFLEVGQLTVLLESTEGPAVRVRTLKPGTVVGEMGLYTHQPRSPSVMSDTAVVVHSLDAFVSRYGDNARFYVSGEYGGASRLSNGGETLTLVSAEGVVVQQVRYEDGGLWPVRADGGGFSLVLRDEGRPAMAGDPATLGYDTKSFLSDWPRPPECSGDIGESVRYRGGNHHTRPRPRRRTNRQAVSLRAGRHRPPLSLPRREARRSGLSIGSDVCRT